MKTLSRNARKRLYLRLAQMDWLLDLDGVRRIARNSYNRGLLEGIADGRNADPRGMDAEDFFGVRRSDSQDGRAWLDGYIDGANARIARESK